MASTKNDTTPEILHHWWQKYQVEIPEGSLGSWKVERFTVSAYEASIQRAMATFSFSMGGRSVPEGAYTRLLRGRTLVMSDTPDEIRDHLDPIHRARGLCLVNGLGLGVVVCGMLAGGAEKVIAIEQSAELIALVGGPLREKLNGCLEIRQADALEYNPPKGERYTVVWHDIWDGICSDNLPAMHRLHRKYGRRCNWQGSWGRRQAER